MYRGGRERERVHVCMYVLVTKKGGREGGREEKERGGGVIIA